METLLDSRNVDHIWPKIKTDINEISREVRVKTIIRAYWESKYYLLEFIITRTGSVDLSKVAEEAKEHIQNIVADYHNKYKPHRAMIVDKNQDSSPTATLILR